MQVNRSSTCCTAGRIHLNHDKPVQNAGRILRVRSGFSTSGRDHMYVLGVICSKLKLDYEAFFITSTFHQIMKLSSTLFFSSSSDAFDHRALKSILEFEETKPKKQVRRIAQPCVTLKRALKDEQAKVSFVFVCDKGNYAPNISHLWSFA